MEQLMKNKKSTLITGLLATLLSQGFSVTSWAQNYNNFPIVLTPGTEKFVACEIPDSNFTYPNSTPESMQNAFVQQSQQCAKAIRKNHPGINFPTLANVSGFILPTTLGTGPLPKDHAVYQYVEFKDSKYQKNCTDKFIKNNDQSFVEKFQMPNLDVHISVACCSADPESVIKSYETNKVNLWTAVLHENTITKGLVKPVEQGENARGNISPSQVYEVRADNGVQKQISLMEIIKERASLKWGYTFERDECLSPPETACGPHSHCIKGWYETRKSDGNFNDRRTFEKHN